MKSKKTKKEIITDISLISIGSIFLLYLTYGFSFFITGYINYKKWSFVNDYPAKERFRFYFGCKMTIDNYKNRFTHMFTKANWFEALMFVVLVLLGIAAIIGYIYLVLNRKKLIQKFKARKEERKQKKELKKEEKYKQSNDYKIEQLQKELEQLKKEKEKEQ